MIIRVANTEDAELLTRMGREIFIESFGRLYSDDDLNGFLNDNFTPQKQFQEIISPDSACLIAEIDGVAAGYAKYGSCKLPVDMSGQKAGELHRLYVYKQFRNAGVGRALASRAFDEMIKSGCSDIYIGVWSENYGAQRFYQSFGFQKFSEYKFMVGKQADHEFILHKRITQAVSAA